MSAFKKVVMVVLILALCVMAYLLIDKFRNKGSKEENKPQQEQVQNNTNNEEQKPEETESDKIEIVWKTYEDPGLKIRVDYPGTWNAGLDEVQSKPGGNYFTPSKEGKLIGFSSPGVDDYVAFIGVYEKTTVKALEEYVPKHTVGKNFAYTNGQFLGYQARIITHENTDGSVHMAHLIFEKDGKVYEITGMSSSSISDDIAVFDRFSTSFRFY